jgi:aminoglycoside 3-N-acetyltransferase
MSITSLYQKIVLLSPRIEYLSRCFYWNNIRLSSKLRPSNAKIKSKKNEYIDFDKILFFLQQNGLKKGVIAIVHSSFRNLKPTNLTANQIIDKLRNILTNEGTLAMPVIRHYCEDGDTFHYLTQDVSSFECIYDVKNTEISTGFLPISMMNMKGVIVSRFPLNPLCALGKEAQNMMEHNIDEDFLSPHGKLSSWKYCYDKHAIVIGLGIDMLHSLTMIHVNEEAFGNWCVKDWFRERKFLIKDEYFEKHIKVLERKPKWGCKHFLEQHLKYDLIKNNILKIKCIDGLEVSVLNSYDLISYLQSKNKTGYPYYISKKYLSK